MSRLPDRSVKLSDTLFLSEYKSGGRLEFWLYDETRGMNLSMRAKTETDALVDAIEYYQERLAKVERDHRLLKKKVDAFVLQFVDSDDD